MAPKVDAETTLKTPLIAKSGGVAASDVGTAAAVKKAVPFTALYRYASPLDVFAMAVALLASLSNGAAFPLLGILFGQLLNALQGSNFVDEINKYALYFLILATICGVTSVLETVIPVVVAARQVSTIRTKYVAALLRQEMAWFDTHSTSAVLAAFPESSAAIQAGMGEKLTDAVRYSTQLLTGLILGFTTSWKLTLVISALAPVFAAALTVLIITNIRTGKQTSEAYARAGGVASEVLSAIRTVFAYGGETHESSRYSTHVLSAANFGIRKGAFIGMCVGVMVASFYLVYGVSLFAGAHFIVDSRNADASCKFDPTGSGCYNGGTVIKTLTCVLIGATSFSQLGVVFGYFASARTAAADLFELIDRVPTIDPFDNGGERPRNVSGRIEFRNVSFAYPSRPDAPVLRDFSLIIEAGQRVGVCGPSGSGKSTLVLLLLRYYDVQSGAVLVDGIDVRRWNLRYLRDAMGLVQQEPVLFGSSIRDNIACGQSGLAVAPSDDEIYDAARSANAHAFITSLPDGYDTLAGTGVASVQLSGGQRQRICIARALLRDPRILLLDEATSALDSTSEREVQAAIDATTAGGSRTAVIIAHRLSTLAQAELVVVMRGGSIVERGSHRELMSLSDGLFRQLYDLQDVSDRAEGPSAALSQVSSQGPASSVDSTATSLGPTVPNKAKLKVFKRKAGAPGGPGGGDEETTQDVVDDVTAPNVSLSRIWGVLAPEWPFVVLGSVCAAAGGAIQPAFALVFANMTNALFNPDSATVLADAERYLIFFVLLAVGSWCIIAARLACFTLLGERLTQRLRVRAFAALMAQKIAYFDESENSPARLASKLASDASLVKGAAGEALGTALEGFFAVAAAMAIALDASWRLGLVVLAAFPLLAFAAVYEFRSSAGIEGGSGEALEASLEVTSEAVAAIRTVAAFNLQCRTLDRFKVLLRTTVAAAVRQGAVSGGGRGLAQFVSLASYSLAFWAGAIFIQRDEMPRDALLKVFLAASLSAQALGRITSFSPDAGRARAAARNVFKIIDSVSDARQGVDGSSSYQGAAIVPSVFVPVAASSKLAGASPPAPGTGSLDAHIEFRDVTFTYPARPGPPALANFSLRIPRGATVALVGESGSGKSTVVALFERFYEPDSGNILVDGVPLPTMDVSSWRDSIGLVQQEPTLWADSVEYNIGYGRRGRVKPAAGTGSQPGVSLSGALAAPSPPSDEISATSVEAVDADSSISGSDPDVVRAARNANALGFIVSFKDGFATFCGARGGQLSGGQKQRVAIARALVRDPQYLLLDEATSALDTQSEAVVQAALDRLLQHQRFSAGGGEAGGRTTLVVAHRLSTVAGADLIVAMRRGAIVEQGTHAELMAREGGYYRQLVLAQSGSAGRGLATASES